VNRFINNLLERDDVYMVTMTKLLEWMENPLTLGQLKNRATAGPFSCKESEVIKPKLPDRKSFVFEN
jgi:hypothetical protein